jgi:hypothetical protein
MFQEAWRFYTYQETVNRRTEAKEIITRQVRIDSDLSKCSDEEFKL